MLDFNSPVNLVNDTTITYNTVKHRYVFTIEGIDALTGRSIVADEGSDGLADIQLDRISRIAYNYIRNWGSIQDYYITEWRISRDTSLVDVLKEAMLALYEADILNSAGQIPYQHGLDLNIDMQTIRHANVPPMVIDTLFSGTLLTRYNFRLPQEAKFRQGY